MSNLSLNDADSLLKELEELFHREILITKHMGVRVKTYEGDSLTLKAPLELNRNHKRTAFGGSLSCLATLAGWGMVYYIVKELDLHAQIIIQEGKTSYLKPVISDFEAICLRPNPGMVEKFKKMVQKKRVGRIPMNCAIYEGDELAVSFRGTYVATVLS